ncbi:hypothetical protein SAMN05444679_11586 [Variovorax sp. CF079]|jgi:hypothetical protein|uniref:hypothetical protein n=1 Tax=Variovorax sp. CF079 TaxID=1882774 RepID=UPI000891C317|nr:hypothetical protein [Variovorax sp. CF079]SDD93475.1 hypothetical protein SAMN05444679_11586 [Variovorax sp. CF079]
MFDTPRDAALDGPSPPLTIQAGATQRDLAQACLDNALALIESVLNDREGENTPAGERAAVRVCVTSAHVLLGAARQLMAEPLYLLAPKERGQRLKALVEEAKTAGRAAYRAALMLTGHE